MVEDSNTPFLDVPTLLERSQPRGGHGRMLYIIAVFVLVVVGSAYLSSLGGAAAALVQAVSALVMVGLLAGLILYSGYVVRQQRAEIGQLEAIEELVTLRRWPQAGMLLELMLRQPTRTPQGRVQALIYLSGVLARYHRFADAILVQNYLLDEVNLDESTAYSIRLGRAMAMLRDDRLFDADRAIADLRRRLNREAEASASESPQLPESSGLTLVEMYRDVKTGHPAEALEIFREKRDLLRRQLGHRVADAWALAARAHDMLGQTDDAQLAFVNATLLAPLPELIRRYPELSALVDKYRPAQAPAEMT